MWSKACLLQIVIFSGSVFFGCSSAEKSDVTKEKFRSVLARENHKLHQDLTLAGGKDFATLDLDQYFILLERHNSSLAKEIKAFSKVELGHTNQVFVLCVLNEDPLIAICDNSSTKFIDRIKMTPIKSLSALMDEIRGP